MNIYEETILCLITFIFGAVIGAYYTTISYRIPNKLPIVSKDCYCPKCKHTLKLYMQIPIAGFLIQHGKCSYCGKKIPFRYPLIELGFSLFYLISYQLLKRNPSLLLATWAVFSVLINIIFIYKNPSGCFKGTLIMLSYNLIYGFLLFIILSQ